MNQDAQSATKAVLAQAHRSDGVTYSKISTRTCGSASYVAFTTKKASRRAHPVRPPKAWRESSEQRKTHCQAKVPRLLHRPATPRRMVAVAVVLDPGDSRSAHRPHLLRIRNHRLPVPTGQAPSFHLARRLLLLLAIRTNRQHQPAVDSILVWHLLMLAIRPRRHRMVEDFHSLHPPLPQQQQQQQQQQQRLRQPQDSFSGALLQRQHQMKKRKLIHLQSSLRVDSVLGEHQHQPRRHRTADSVLGRRKKPRSTISSQRNRSDLDKTMKMKQKKAKFRLRQELLCHKNPGAEQRHLMSARSPLRHRQTNQHSRSGPCQRQQLLLD
mmetsp:Transcript_23061/g.65362  ORF Transcript_23061/g.65362 Transcript_23061/m.65362 type:complete len:325 (+) Transcript_23061:1390-2364(+)